MIPSSTRCIQWYVLSGMLNLAHLSRVDLNLLVVFRTVLEERHVGRAAHRLSLTPSAVSHGLRRLRLLFNDPLFLPTAKGVVPTDRALALGEPVAEILARFQEVLDASGPFDPATSSRRFVVGAPDAVLIQLAAPLLERIQAEAPRITIALVHLMPLSREGPWREPLAQLERRELDLALLPLSAVASRFHAQRLYAEDFVVAMRRGHRFARDPSEAAFLAAKHLLVSLRGEAWGFVDEMLAKRGQERRIVLTVPSFAVALDVVARSDLLAALPRRLVQRQGAHRGVTMAELPFKRPPDVLQVVAAKTALADPGVAWLMRLLVELEGRALRRT